MARQEATAVYFFANTGLGDVGYEVQILDCYNNTTYVNGQTGSVYKQTIPLANACKNQVNGRLMILSGKLQDSMLMVV